MDVPCVYIVANKRTGTLYTGVTCNLIRRILEHKEDLVDGFSRLYRTRRLVWYELHEEMDSAVAREKQIEGESREHKLALIEHANPAREDLYPRVR